MQNVWNIGNTTVRNPQRIVNALKVFISNAFSGNAKGFEQESGFHQALKEREILYFDGEASDWNGRKWRAAFYQLGLISNDKYNIQGNKLTVKELFQNIGNQEIILPYQITPVGLKLIETKFTPEIDEIYTRQLACYELPNSLETGFPEGKLKPFILFLQVLTLLQNKGLPGLTRLETGLFLQKFQNHTNILADQLVENIVIFRNKCENKTPKELKIIKQQYSTQLALETGIQPDSIINDYSDTTFRYFGLSGLFTRIGGTIIIAENKRDFVNKLIAKEPVFLFQENPLEYFKQFYNNTYHLPTDQLDNALLEIESLEKEIKDIQNPLLKKAKALKINSDPLLIQKIRFELIEYYNKERESDYAKEQKSEVAIKDIIVYLKALNNDPTLNKFEIPDRPAFLEWAVWRSFLAINEITCPIYKTRRFPVDQDFFPRTTAPGGGSDLIFEFASYVLVVEVTLTKSHRQMAAESEPVMRHAAQYKMLYPDKEVYCLFVAPTLDNNIVEQFRTGFWYNEDVEEVVNVIPMSLNDFIVCIETLTIKRFRNIDFKNLLDRSLSFRNFRTPQWKAGITKEVTEWIKRILI